MSLEGIEIPLIGMAVLASAALAERAVRVARFMINDSKNNRALQVAETARIQGQAHRRKEADARLKVWQVTNGIPVEGNGLSEVA